MCAACPCVPVLALPARVRRWRALECVACLYWTWIFDSVDPPGRPGAISGVISLGLEYWRTVGGTARN
jgi:hypothetical protein